MGNDNGLIADVDEADIVVSDRVMLKVLDIVADVLHLPKDAIGPDTIAADVEGWDSFGHVRIILAVDQAFGIELSMGAIERADGVPGLVEVVDEALAQN